MRYFILAVVLVLVGCVSERDATVREKVAYTAGVHAGFELSKYAPDACECQSALISEMMEAAKTCKTGAYKVERGEDGKQHAVCKVY